MALVVKNPLANTGDWETGFNPWVGKIPWRRACPLQYYCLKNPMDRVAWQATVYRGAKSWTQLKQLSTDTSKAKFRNTN